jgi:hypothetical protein
VGTAWRQKHVKLLVKVLAELISFLSRGQNVQKQKADLETMRNPWKVLHDELCCGKNRYRDDTVSQNLR